MAITPVEVSGEVSRKKRTGPREGATRRLLHSQSSLAFPSIASEPAGYCPKATSGLDAGMAWYPRDPAGRERQAERIRPE